MRRDTSKTREPKARYRVRNWAAYNAGLINRGNVTMWIDEAALASMPEAEPTCGRPRLYCDALIQALLGLKTMFRLPLRVLQGFAQNLRELAFATLPVPNYTTLCRRAQPLEVQLPIVRDGDPIHLVVDSTGVKVYGEGEWKVRQHGYSKRRTWRKVHVALDANTGQVRAAPMTHRNVVDGDVLAELLEWKKGCGCHRRSLAENAMYRLKTLTGNRPWARRTESQATEVAIRVGVLNRMAALAHPQSVRIA